MTEPLLWDIITSPIIAISTIFNIAAPGHTAVHAYLDTHIVVGGCAAPASTAETAEAVRDAYLFLFISIWFSNSPPWVLYGIDLKH